MLENMKDRVNCGEGRLLLEIGKYKAVIEWLKAPKKCKTGLLKQKRKEKKRQAEKGCEKEMKWKISKRKRFILFKIQLIIATTQIRIVDSVTSGQFLHMPTEKDVVKR